MFFQRVLLKLHREGLMKGPFRSFLENRTWTVEGGQAAGMKFAFPQNLDFVRGSSEMPMQTCITSHLRPGDTFYDVGANVGFFSMVAARRVGASGAVYSFEPVAENAATVRRNAALNALQHVTVFEVAVEAKTSTKDLFVTEWDGGASLSSRAVETLEGVTQRVVPVVSLDDFIGTKKLRPPTVVKIDVEGAELGVLEGMRETVAKYRPVLVYEVDDHDRKAFVERRAAIDRFVADLGYDVSHLQDSYPDMAWHVGHSLGVPRVR